LIPTAKVFQIRNGKKIAKEGMFAGLRLVRSQLMGDALHRVRETPMYWAFLGEINNIPTPIRTLKINRILG
jgi:transcriptional antiterminator NusG